MKQKKSFVMIATLVTILLLAFSLAACHKTSGDDNNNPDTPPSPPTPPAPTEFTVTFDSCGGNTVPSVKGKTVQTEPLPEKDGFDFVGWYENSDYSGNRVVFPYTISKDVKFYAKWQEKATFVQTTLDDFEYTEADGKITLTKYKGNKEHIILPENASALGGQVFQLAEDESTVAAIKSLKIPGNIESIDGLSLFWSVKLYTIEVDENNVKYASKGGVLFNKTLDTLIAYPMGRSVETTNSYVIPEGVKTIEQYAFTGYQRKSLILPSTLETIKYCAFSYAYLEEITFPSGLKTVGAFGIYNMPSLKKATFPKDAAFSSDNYLLNGCESLEELTAPADIYNMCYISSEAFKTLKITAGETVKSIGEGKKNLETLVLADTVKTIGKSAFSNLTKLSSVTFSASLETIGSSAFYGCKSLTAFNAPSSLKTIGQYAFYGCESLTVFNAPSSLKTIEYGAFANSGLETVTLNEGLESIPGEDNSLDAYMGPFDYTKIKTLKVPSTVKKVCVFGRISSLETLYISADFMKSVFNRRQSTFVRHLYLTGGTLSVHSSWLDNFYDVHFASGVTSTNTYDLSLPALIVNESNVQVSVPDDYLGEYVTSESAVTGKFVAENDMIYYSYNGRKILMRYTGEKTVIEASDLSGITDINPEAFISTNITSVTLPSSVKSIGLNAFGNCKNLSTVYIPSSVEKIAGYAFNWSGSDSSSITFRCAASEKPAGWDEKWSKCNGTPNIIWNA